ncbi:MAG: EamA family transporter [Rhodospirillaceae bacterium]|nr:EamA family transporter [Rhodospirillaceae bacterium]
MGILLAVLATLLFACLNSLTKHASAVYPMVMILWFRYLLFGGFGLAIAVRAHHWRAFSTLIPLLQITRAVLLVTEVGMYVFAFRHLPLAEIAAISGIAPMVATAMSAVLLREAVGIRRWAAVAVGFVGVLIIVRPGFGSFNVWMLLPLVGTVLWALYQVLTRLASQSDGPERTTMFTGTVGFGLLCLISPLFWEPVDFIWTVKLLALAAFGVAGHSLLIKALSLAPASLLQPFSYTGMVWAVLFGWAFFNDFPDAATILGAIIIVTSGLYTLHRQRVRKVGD